MLLCLDVGNSQVFGGLFNHQKDLVLRFRLTSKSNTSDEFGIFLLQVLRENQMNPEEVTKISICSVVPHLDYSLRSACIKYFSVTPFFIQSGIQSSVRVDYGNASELGADRLANAIAATTLYPNQNLIVIDFGTAITFCAIDANKSYLGGAIYPGFRLLVDTLARNTAKLPVVEVVEVEHAVATTTVQGIQSGIFFGTLGACKEMIHLFRAQTFKDQSVKVLATGGFSVMFEKYGLYDEHLPDLILHGIQIATDLNPV
ncbi:MAG: type III pantothenate kinase [Gammaproteobacteria bacterium]|nr:type III pantothenate kinase [Gammaproteobacteria bacterium]